jgi:phosphoribosyl-ATP pyrophosphohydrolase/phosphoribosyl-AMP cyclohydrolase
VNFEKSKDGLLPAVIQDAKTREVLMLGYMNEESLKATRETGLVTFFSRSRQAIWVKGETSGNHLHVVEISSDCDSDAILISANPEGPTCHQGTSSCFDHSQFGFLRELAETIDSRVTKKPEGSYVAKLLGEGLDRIAQKVGEEAVETVIASMKEDPAPLESEAADLLFHLMVLLRAKGTSLPRVIATLERRHRK